MADHLEPRRGDEQEVSSSGLLLSVEPSQGAGAYRLSADDKDAGRDTTDVVGDDSDASDADGSDASDSDGSDDASDADGTDVSDADGTDTGRDADGTDPLGIASDGSDTDSTDAK